MLKNANIMTLMCNVVKECNLKRHYLTKHSVKFDSLNGNARKNKI